jgi:putative pyruvate formate lyase activating enzyme
VTGGHFQPSIAEALEDAKANGLMIPIVYNTSAYESLDTIRSLDGLVDIYLPDLKYFDSTLSMRYSHAADYFQIASKNIEEMVRQTGEPLFRIKPKHSMQESYEMWESEAALPISATEYNEICDMDEEAEILMQRGTIVRHLLLPGCTEDSKRVIGYLLDTFGDEIYISIMNQFTPLKNVEDYPELNRKVTEKEYDEVIQFAINHGIENAFIQEGDVAEESFIPSFDYEGL